MARKKAPPIIILMQDKIQHTIMEPICQKKGCICRQLEYEQLLADVKKPAVKRRVKKIIVERNYESEKAPLNYRNEGFSLLKRPIPITRGRNRNS